MTGADRVPVSVVVMTYNEELNLERCLESISGRAGEIIVVDSFSTDLTREIAERYTDKIFHHAYEGHPQQWRWALENLPFAYEWVLAVDADFSVTLELWAAIAAVLRRGDPWINGYFVRHRQMFRGRFLRHGTIYPRYWLRLFRRGSVQVDPFESVDVHFYVGGPTGRLEHDLIEDNRKDDDLEFWIQKQVRFAKRQAADELRRRTSHLVLPVRASLLGTPNERTLWFKERWYRLPLYVRPVLLFGYRYVFRLGFLDGKAGFLYHVTQAFLYRLLVDVRIDEVRVREGAGAMLPEGDGARGEGGQTLEGAGRQGERCTH